MSKKKLTIEERITHAMIEETSSAEVLPLLEELESAIENYGKVATQAHDEALKLTADPDKSERAWRSAELKRDRLKGALPRLEQRYHSLKDAEELGTWRLRYHAVKSDCTALAREFHEKMPELFGAIVDLFQRMLECDKSVNEVNSSAPPSAHERLLSTELVARNVLGLGGSVSILKTTQLPDLKDPNRAMWPPPQPNLAAEMAQAFMPAYDKRFSPRWHEAAAEEDQRRRTIQAERIAQEDEKRAQAYTDYNQQRADGGR